MVSCGRRPINHAYHYLLALWRQVLVLLAEYDNYRRGRQSHVLGGPTHSGYSLVGMISTPKNRRIIST